MIRLIIIMISLFAHIENYFDSTTIYVTMQIIMNISSQYYKIIMYTLSILDLDSYFRLLRHKEIIII